MRAEAGRHKELATGKVFCGSRSEVAFCAAKGKTRCSFRVVLPHGIYTENIRNIFGVKFSREGSGAMKASSGSPRFLKVYQSGKFLTCRFIFITKSELCI